MKDETILNQPSPRTTYSPIAFPKNAFPKERQGFCNVFPANYPQVTVQQNMNLLSSNIFQKLQAEAKKTAEEFEKNLVNSLKFEDSLDINAKVSLTKYMLFNSHLFPILNDFYEEECHLCLVNWAWNLREVVKTMELCRGDNICLVELYSVLELLNNIFNILQRLRISSQDLLNLKMFEKINKLKGYLLNFVENNFSFSFILIVAIS